MFHGISILALIGIFFCGIFFGSSARATQDGIFHSSCHLVMDYKLVKATVDYQFDMAEEFKKRGYQITQNTVYPSDRARPGELYVVSYPLAIFRDPNNGRVGCKCGFEIMERYEGGKDRDLTGVLSAYSEYSCTVVIEELIRLIPTCHTAPTP